MEEWLNRLSEGIIGRLTGPLHFRLFLQPALAAIFAIRAGIIDSREDRPAYFWAIFTGSDHWRELVRDGWRDVARIFFLAVIMDVIYQLLVLRRVYALEALIVAVILAVAPYFFARGPANRLARLWRRPSTPLRPGPSGVK